MEIAVISDTHMPRGATRRLPDECIARLEAADLIVHAGDFMRAGILEQLQTYNRIVAVHGNIDDAELRETLPERATVTTPEGAQLGVVHDAGPSKGRLERLRRMFPEASAVVFGHSHIPLHERAPDGFQIFNPGSPTERRRAPRHTMGLARVGETSHAIAFELIALD
jgi:putative phosphoesterase